ncbi:MAG: aspartate aminotransferase family protein [Myxococcales bacterium]|nr:aspartate aminotransferase family protein [Myxococcales bacterium]
MSDAAASPAAGSALSNDALRRRLAAVECPGVTTFSPHWPIFWVRGDGATVWDADGRDYIDLTAAFGVAALGHAHPAVTAAVSAQAGTLLHGMGDVHPPLLKVLLLERLAELAPGDLHLGMLGLNGADAVETALRCAHLVTGKPGVVAFEGAYHGLLGRSLAVTARRDFRDPFGAPGRTTFVEFPHDVASGERALAELSRKFRSKSSGLPPIGALIVEPIQGRGGIVVPPDGFLREVASLCRQAGVMFVVDEILTGFGRTGTLFAIEREGIVPDLLCLGKALGGGMPISACIGHDGSLGRWPAASGEALLTATFAGHPGAAAAALATLDIITGDALTGRAERLGSAVRARIEAAGLVARGRGLMLAIEVGRGLTPDGIPAGVAVMEKALEAGVIVLCEGAEAEVIAITPPLTIDETLLGEALDRVIAIVKRVLPGLAPEARARS